MSVSARKDIRALCRLARKQGWTIYQTKGHLRWVPPSGLGAISSSQTPSDLHAVDQLKRDLRRKGLDV